VEHPPHHNDYMLINQNNADFEYPIVQISSVDELLHFLITKYLEINKITSKSIPKTEITIMVPV
jgi:hypothetical protein